MIASTLRDSPIRAIVFGRDGIGKSTFCAGAPGAVFISTESGLENIDTRAVESPRDWPSLINCVNELAVEPSCQTVVIDSLDWAEQLAWKHLCDAEGVSTIEEVGKGYGKGYVAAMGLWRAMINALEGARREGKGVLLIAHAERKPVKNPTGEDYESWLIKINQKASALLREWVDVVGFAELDMATTKVDGPEKRHKGFSMGKRVLRTSPSPGHDGKSRFTLPAKIPLDWPSFDAALRAGKKESVASLRAHLGGLLVLPESADIRDACAKFLADNGESSTSLRTAIETVKIHMSEKCHE
jgi:AAA domain